MRSESSDHVCKQIDGPAGAADLIPSRNSSGIPQQPRCLCQLVRRLWTPCGISPSISYEHKVSFDSEKRPTPPMPATGVAYSHSASH
ncbi:uncharacterized protein L969DRAFT_92938 [Mixia osmundae IAM 14324]|uniref:uncharacterized protein n=1 Tax=Mixia osmundae (strain CBS 9802 / IAM 14324 / JCM 22182 / KY 12970) TaxID=764103 RepID=UPI0004A55090|nr:uncharacterized protein L969DRAFT_92938 [Mixia osmundae IAM 14324]KEI41715.1 hypothetical protein L969DRAFT_92938 [Mixia osmundae IAM 14324]